MKALQRGVSSKKLCGMIISVGTLHGAVVWRLKSWNIAMNMYSWTCCEYDRPLVQARLLTQEGFKTLRDAKGV